MSGSTKIIILVTGANRGIGFALMQALGSHPDLCDSVLLLGSRDMKKGEAAAKELQDLVASSRIVPLILDVTSDLSIENSVQWIDKTYGKLDVLVNNAGAAAIPESTDSSEWRSLYTKIFDTNVTSVAVVTHGCLPLLRKTEGSKVINMSSGRASLNFSTSDSLPPTASMPYSISKTALNMLTIEMSKDPSNKDVEFQMVSPGHCKTAFNNYRGLRDPVEGANVVVELIKAPAGRYKNAGFWETKGANLELVEIPW